MHETQLDRIERKLDALLDALAEEQEDEDQPSRTLDGQDAGQERDPLQPL
jgi:hypothetical protein